MAKIHNHLHDYFAYSQAPIVIKCEYLLVINWNGDDFHVEEAANQGETGV